MTTLGTKIRKLRELKNFKQDHMAELLGISTNAYGKIERDETDVSHDRLEQIAKALDLTVTDILNFDEKMIFNIMNNKDGVFGMYNTGSPFYTQFPEEMKKHYEDKIKLLEDKIEYLQRENERLREEK
ncbi:MAG: helix-turn-helix domain-containing protein [Sporocytophaga sp.]|nr:helix-turn-helix domain-containing protein [Sporocytophaga sp.]